MNKVLIGEGLKPQGPNLCVLNVLRSLVEDKKSIVYIPQSYELGSFSSFYDKRVHRIPTEAGKSIIVSSLQSHSERFNFSLTGIIDVLVEEELLDGMIELVPKKIFKTYNIIRDGELIIDHLICKLSSDSFEIMRQAKILFYSDGTKVPENHLHNSEFLYKVVLKDIPLVSLHWAQPLRIGLYNYMVEEVNLVALQSALNKLIKKYKAEGQKLTNIENSDFYREIRDTSTKNSYETYQVDCIVYRIKQIKKPVIKEDELEQQYPTIELANKAVKEVRSRLRDIRYVSRCIVYAIEESRKKGSFDWSEKYDIPRSKDKIGQKVDIFLEDKTITLERVSYKTYVERKI